MGPEENDGVLTWRQFTAYMDGFGDRLAAKFASREACGLKHRDLDTRLDDGDKKFDAFEARIRKLERNVLIGATLLAVAQWLTQNGFLTIGGR